jgi:pyruvoyl-dependent arginine decarboxylase (PvlArgDC)
VEAQQDGAGALIYRAALGKKIADQSGAIVASDVDAYINGVNIVQDTSLTPNEKRIVMFDLGMIPQGKVSVTARAYLSNATHNSHIPLASAEMK